MGFVVIMVFSYKLKMCVTILGNSLPNLTAKSLELCVQS